MAPGPTGQERIRFAAAINARRQTAHTRTAAPTAMNPYYTLYDATVVRPFAALAGWFWRFWDEKIVDGTVNGVAAVFEGLSAVLRLFQTGFVGTYALFFTLGVAALLLHFLRH